MAKVNNRDVARAFSDGVPATGSNFYTDGCSVWSYGPHFKIAQKLYIDGKRIVLFTTRDYSRTTAKHKSYVLQALRHAEIFIVPNIDGFEWSEEQDEQLHKQNASYLYAQISLHLSAAERARKGSYINMHLNSAGRAEAMYTAYCSLFDVPLKPSKTRTIDELIKTL